ncbi:hypothetical protein NEF87_002162 [Candidatus Lokiarchaeum ossiferum]|uniref:ABC transmembrane type-2 domain-containing protein n=1 Tax=Candidatus Lokiarchaeum ossiferum TaxID=2951803 RepID=A0ABY6HU52_9ARCH|nr:hypothetical protein NEF87_002162 [Candidatus Lokiarchaeum sp. B-35]
MEFQRIRAIVKMEIKRQLRDPLTLFITTLMVPALIVVMGLSLDSVYSWSPDYSVFEIMFPGFLAYGCLLTIFDVAGSVATEKELGVQIRLITSPLSSSEYIFAQLIAYTIKPLVQAIIGIPLGYLVGYRPDISVMGYILIVVFLIILTFCSVGFGLITASLVKNAGAAQGLAFAFIVPQQIFGSFIPAAFFGLEKFAWVLPSFYATDGIGLIFAGTNLLDSQIWLRMLLLCTISLVIYVIGTFLFEKNKKS